MYIPGEGTDDKLINVQNRVSQLVISIVDQSKGRKRLKSGVCVCFILNRISGEDYTD